MDREGRKEVRKTTEQDSTIPKDDKLILPELGIKTITLTHDRWELVDLPTTYLRKSRYIQTLKSEFGEEAIKEKIHLQPASNKDFSAEDVKDVLWLYHKLCGKAENGGLFYWPDIRKPLLSHVTLHDFFDDCPNEPGMREFEAMLTPKYFSKLVGLFNVCFFMRFDEMKEIIAARIAHFIILDRKSPEDFARKFKIISSYHECGNLETQRLWRKKNAVDNENNFVKMALDPNQYAKTN
jgi:hypothetical protein